MSRLFIFLFSFGLLACSPASDGAAQSNDAVEIASTTAADLGPAINTSFPAFSLEDADGSSVTLEDLAGANGTIIYFNRSVDWCPFCQVQTLEVNNAAADFDRLGYGVAVITYDPVDELSMFVDRRDITIPLLSDPDSALIDTLGIRDPVYTDQDHWSWGVPYPITFVLNAEGVITHKFWHEPGLGEDRGYRMRITIEDVLATLN